MSLMPGDFGSMVRAQQSAQADRQQANQAVQNMRNRFANMGPGMTQIPTSGPYAGGYGQPFARQAPMMDMRGIGGLLAGLVRGFGGGFGGGYSPQGPQYGQPRSVQDFRISRLINESRLQEAPNPFRPPPILQGDAYMRGPMSDEQRAQSQARLSARMQELGISPDDVPEYAAPPSPQRPDNIDAARPALRDLGAPLISTGAPMGNELPQPPPFQGGFGQPQSGPRQGLMFGQPLMGNTSQPQGGFGQPPMGGAPGGKGGAKGGGTFGQPSYGMQARYSSPFGNLF